MQSRVFLPPFADYFTGTHAASPWAACCGAGASAIDAARMRAGMLKASVCSASMWTKVYEVTCHPHTHPGPLSTPACKFSIRLVLVRLVSMKKVDPKHRSAL
jgi:hypothetical protein